MLFEGIVWDGAGKASEAASTTARARITSRHVIHRNERSSTWAPASSRARAATFPYKNATAEVLFDNCLFVNVGNGVVFLELQRPRQHGHQLRLLLLRHGHPEHHRQRLCPRLPLRGQPGVRHLHARGRQLRPALHLGRLQAIPPQRRPDVRDAGLPRRGLEVRQGRRRVQAGAPVHALRLHVHQSAGQERRPCSAATTSRC